MIKDTDDKKIIFDKNKKFNTNNYEIRNQVNNREIQINDETVLHACISDITFDTTKITINFLSKDDLEFTYEISKEAETGEIPDYLQINETDVVQLAIKIFTLEAYKVFMNDTTLPEATAINELQATITDLQSTITNLQGTITEKETTITNLQGTITEKETTITTLNEQLANMEPPVDTKITLSTIDINDITFYNTLSAAVSNEKLNGGQIRLVVDDTTLIGYGNASSDYVNAMGSIVEITDLKINDTAITISAANVTNNAQTGAVTDKVTWVVNFSSSGVVDALENNTVSIKFKNKTTNYVRTINGTFAISGTTIGDITTVADE